MNDRGHGLRVGKCDLEKYVCDMIADVENDVAVINVHRPIFKNLIEQF
jgi:hypothetical protein